MNRRLKGTLCGIGAAVSYGMNPLGALPLYAEGLNTNTILFYRYGLAVIFLLIVLLFNKKNFLVTKKELPVLALLGMLFAVSSLSLYGSFNYMDAGIACTILFVYPVMVAIIMAVFFKEKITAVTSLSIFFALWGISLLYNVDGNTTLSIVGVLLVILSSLSYALYIVIVNKSSLRMSSVKLSFWVLIFCVITIVVNSLFEIGPIQLLTTSTMWGYSLLLAFFPTFISLLLMVIAVHDIGSTPTAIMGALEPITAVIIGVCIFNETLSVRSTIGMALVLLAVLLIVCGKAFPLSRLKIMVGNIERTIVKYWRWR